MMISLHLLHVRERSPNSGARPLRFLQPFRQAVFAFLTGFGFLRRLLHGPNRSVHSQFWGELRRQRIARQQLSAKLELPGPESIGQKAEVADAHEALGQDGGSALPLR
ncbi:MAG: hypothetical protein HY508_07780 [Acidobacteria bacterium]|nr:hypothetical protein [Acidobacteriota bacterium]